MFLLVNSIPFVFCARSKPTPRNKRITQQKQIAKKLASFITSCFVNYVETEYNNSNISYLHGYAQCCARSAWA